MEALIAANPDVFSGLTVDDAEEIVHQIQLELAQINEGDASPGTAQELGIDITDIVTGDIDLASLAAQLQPNPQDSRSATPTSTPCHRLPPYRSTMSRPDRNG